MYARFLDDFFDELNTITRFDIGFDKIDFAVARRGRLAPPGQFSGWSSPISLREAIAPKPRNQPAGRLHDTQHRLYRISIRGQRQPLYIGMTNTGVATRIRNHYRGGGNSSNRLHQRLTQLRNTYGDEWVSQNVKVRIGNITHYPRDRIDMNLLHQYEMNLQRQENPEIYDPSQWSFDELD